MLTLLVALAAGPDAAAKKPLDHSVYDGWQSIRGTTISDDGKWIAYGIYPQEGDGTLYVTSTDHPATGQSTYKIERGNIVRFSADSHFLVVSQAPPFADTRAARNAAPGRPAAPGGGESAPAAPNAPVAGLVVLDLKSGQKFEKARVSTTRMALHDKGWVAYQLAPERRQGAPAGGAAPAGGGAARGGGARGGGAAGGGAQRRGGAAGGGGGAAPTPARGETWILRELATGKEQTFADVTSVEFDRDGTEMAYTVAAQDKTKNGVVYLDLKTGKKSAVASGAGRYLHATFSEDGRKLAYLSDNDAPEAKPPVLRLYAWDRGDTRPKAVAKLGDAGLNKDWAPADGALEFSRDDKRLFFQSAPKPVEAKPDPTPEADKAQIDVWNWQDPRLQSQQLMQAGRDRNRSFMACVELRSGRITEEATPALPSVTVGNHGDAEYGFAATNVPYELQDSWDTNQTDLYRVEVKSGRAMKLPAGTHSRALASPDGSSVAVFDLAAKTMTDFDLRTGAGHPVKLPKTSLTDVQDDHPDLAPTYGLGPYTSDGKWLVAEDENDVWLLDTTGKSDPKCLTDGFGRRWSYQLRLLPTNVDPEEGTVDVAKPLLLAARNLEDESSGVYSLAGGQLKRLVYGPKGYAVAAKAKSAETLAFTESSFDEFPDVWLTDTSWNSPVKLSAANSQAGQYRWGTCELIKWIGNDGQALKGLLYKPENMDPSKKYPMITYYYERNSQGLYGYHPPAPSASTINISLFVSNGYVVFVPDIDYKVGYPGPSAYSAIVPGVQAILARGFVDPKRLGLQGQSWGGYETAYLVTQTNMFAAAEAGAPVANMLSAYGGIRLESGVVREGQYEHGQSRIGGSIWEKPLQYLENSPLIWADRIQTPLMIMSNDADGAVPHEQGIEFFTAMRRLRKPCWMVVYNNEQHNLVERRNRKDLSIRLSQFFDHYLKGAPMPMWMSKGVPAVNKGKDYGLDLDPDAP
ncbi:MAG TPA: prolyl oligopeptidase family serine peptidase [Fimbriimonadaceae bacterium]|nr:prolyl oligopeptidase family serine peptidase [Fimbriimonadaceae bacterium]